MPEQTAPVALVPLIVALVEAAKQGFGLPTRWAPLLAIVLGLAASLALGTRGAEVVLSGLALGLSAAGLYSGARRTVSGA